MSSLIIGMSRASVLATITQHLEFASLDGFSSPSAYYSKIALFGRRMIAMSAYTTYTFFLALIIMKGVAFVTSDPPDVCPAQAYPKNQEVSALPCLQLVERRSADCSLRKLLNVPQTLQPDILTLDLSSNNLTVIHNTSLQRYSQLTDLNLEDNNIHCIESGVFYGLQHLNTLVLSGNLMSDIRMDLFVRNSSELQTLDLGKNRLTHFTALTMEYLPNLKTLILSDNNLSVVNITGCSKIKGRSIKLFTNNFQKITPETFSVDCPMELLNLYENPIKTVNPNTIAALFAKVLKLGGGHLPMEVIKDMMLGISRSTIIRELEITFANMSNIPTDLFDSLRNKNLSKLTMSNNPIVNLYPRVFSNLTRLQQFFLDNCGIRVIRPEHFHGMSGLSFLSLTGNQLAVINPYKTTWKVNLRKMDLSSNALQNLDRFAFQGLDQLTSLRLFEMTLHSPRVANVFINLPGLKFLTLTASRIHSLTLYTPFLESFTASQLDGYSMFSHTILFRNSSSLQVIDLGSAELVESSIWNSYNHVSLFNSLNNLKTLQLDNNQLEHLFRDLFENLHLLQDLGLESNQIKSIEPDAFAELTSLIYLNLRDNQLHFISHFLHDLNMLQTLRIGSNGISYIDNDAFSILPNLTSLTLDNNRLVGFNRTTFDPLFKSLTSLDISGNPLVCNCYTKWFNDWLREKLSNEVQTFCSSAASTLDPMKGKPLSIFKPSDLCGVNIAMYCIASFAAAAVLLICIIVYCNRWVLKYKYFLLKLAVLGYNEIQDARDQEEFDYDINIMFVDANEDWVKDYLIPHLEDRLPGLARIAFGDDDLQLGKHYLDAVYDIVEGSFKTLLVVSRAAVQDHMFMTKFRIAMNHVSDTETENIILIFLEDVPDEELPYLVRLYLSGHRAYVRWTEDREGQEYFWNELTKRLAVNLKINHLIPLE